MSLLAVALASRLLAQGQDPVASGTVRQSSKGEVEVLFIPPGQFTMGSEESEDEKPVRKVTLDGYWIGRNLVTVAQFRAYCMATGKALLESNKPEWGWQDDHPIVNVTWDEARAFCQWAGGDLPTEAQWEKAARGTDARTFPWGNQWDPAKCRCSKEKFGDAKSTSPVGSYRLGASPYGCFDMAGNVRQWCLDWYAESGYDEMQLQNPAGPASGKQRVLRGGSWYNNTPWRLRSAFRGCDTPDFRFHNNGFRLAVRSF